MRVYQTFIDPHLFSPRANACEGATSTVEAHGAIKRLARDGTLATGSDEASGAIMQRIEQIMTGKAVNSGNPIVPKKAPTSPRGLAGEGALEGKIVPRKVSRTSNQRREGRHHGIAAAATVQWEEGEAQAKVINLSEQGLMIEATIAPGIGDKVQVTFEGCDPIEASVIWRKDYRLGLDLGEAAIDLFPED
jgi:hypothetical protein